MQSDAPAAVSSELLMALLAVNVELLFVEKLICTSTIFNMPDAHGAY